MRVTGVVPVAWYAPKVNSGEKFGGGGGGDDDGMCAGSCRDVSDAGVLCDVEMARVNDGWNVCREGVDVRRWRGDGWEMGIARRALNAIFHVLGMRLRVRSERGRRGRVMVFLGLRLESL